jgi:integrase
MSRKKKGEHPSLRRHRARGLGVVTLNGVDVYLGRWPAGEDAPAEVQAAYDRAIAEWLQRGRKPPPSATGEPQPPSSALPPRSITVAELVDRWWRWGETYYVHPGGEPTGELANCRLALRPLVHLYGGLAAADLGPLKLKAVRELMVVGYSHPDYGRQQPLSRGQVNSRVQRVLRVYRWGVGEELVPVAVFQALKAVPGLPKGRSAARETEPVLPVAEGVVERTLPHLRAGPRAMVRVQLLTGMRPGEVCRLRLADLDRSGEVWFYRPARHKTRYRGKSRVVAIGPKAQAVLNEYVAARHVPPDKPVFSPEREREERFAEMRARRKTKVQPWQASRRKARPKRAPAEAYTTDSYNHAVAKACLKAGAGHWHVNQLRHSHATKVRRLYGLEAAQVSLGHSEASVTEVYAERDLALAERVAREVG